MEKLCNYFSTVGAITWRRSALAIYITPFVLLFLIVNIMLDLNAFTPAAVVSNSKVCSEIGRKVLEDLGSAVDAAIATLICEGVCLPNDAGIGGGFAATLFVRGRFDTIIATPGLPKEVENRLKLSPSNEKEPTIIGVPGELLGYWEMHKKYGLLPWKRLFEPSIKLAENGVHISQYFAQALLQNAPRLSMSPSMVKKFPKIGQYKVGDRIRYPHIAQTLRRIANEGVSIFYNGDLGRDFVRDIKQNGGLMTESDLRSYKVSWDDNPPRTRFKGHPLVTTPLPTSGPLLILVINMIKSLDYRDNVALFWHKTLQALKFSLGLSGKIEDVNSRIMDQDFAKHARDLIAENKTFNDSEDYDAHQVVSFEKGSLNVCVVGTESDAVAVSSGISFPFGSSFVSDRTGIIPNNILTRYLSKDTRQEIATSKRMLTPHNPTIVIHRNKANPFFIIGATGGPNAVTSTVTVLSKYIIFQESAFAATNSDKGHNTVFPNLVVFNDKLTAGLNKLLKKRDHPIDAEPTTVDNFTNVNCIGLRFELPELLSGNKVGEKSQIFFPDQRFGLILVITTGGMIVIIIAILFYEVQIPMHQMVISKSRSIL